MSLHRCGWFSGLSSGKIVVIYLVVGIFWILLTSFLVSEVSQAVMDVFLYELFKGLFFVFTTGALLWILCKIWERQFARAAAEKAETMKHLEAARIEAEQANRAKSDFLAVMSHEFRTPLNPIMGYASLLLDDPKDEEQREAFKEILHASGRMLHLIDDLLFFSHFNEREISDQMDAFDLLSLVDQTVAESRLLLPSAEILVENGFGAFEPIGAGEMMEGHPELVKRVVHEILINGIKFGEKKPVSLRFGVQDQEEGAKRIRIEVEDSGIGVSEEFLKRIFYPFEQADASKTRRFQGVGLGLAICRKIADFLGGDLSGQSRQGGGTCFSFEFSANSPRWLDEVSAEGGGSKSVDQGSRGETSFPTKSMPRVLVVEDDPANIRVTRLFFKRWDFRIDIASDGREAVEKCRSEKYDLILMDLFMPVMNGFEAGEHILQPGEKNSTTPIIALSAHVDGGSRDRCLKMGMKGFVSKPVGVEEMRTILTDLGLLAG